VLAARRREFVEAGRRSKEWTALQVRPGGGQQDLMLLLGWTAASSGWVRTERERGLMRGHSGIKCGFRQLPGRRRR